MPIFIYKDQGRPLAGMSTLHRLGRTPSHGPQGRYGKIVEDPAVMDTLPLDGFVEAYSEPPEEVITPQTIRCTASRSPRAHQNHDLPPELR